ncbi:M1 family peptidase [bacterium]|nr:MAG: M1 family peptidase [bacterium]
MKKPLAAALGLALGGLPPAQADAQLVRAPLPSGRSVLGPSFAAPLPTLAAPVSAPAALPGFKPTLALPVAVPSAKVVLPAPLPNPLPQAGEGRVREVVQPHVGVLRALTAGQVSFGRYFDRSSERGALSACADHDQPGAFLAEVPAEPAPARGWWSSAAAFLRRTLMKAKTDSMAPLALRSDPATGRLPRTARPESYDLHVTLDPDAGRFSGTVKIAVDLDAPVKELSLHAVGLNFSKAAMDGAALGLDALSADAAAETVTLRLREPLGKGRHTLELAWTGELGKHMKGLYQSKAEHEGKTENYAFTHFEPTDARRMFPSFDEPEFKAVFKTTLSGPERLTLLSNMPATKTTVAGGVKTVSFAPTPKMSTYLLAVAAGRLVPQTRKVEGVDVTVWTRPSEAGQAGFALDAAEHALKSLNAYFDLPYRLPKMDLVAVPDFAAGAMENWGVIFFRDSALLVDPKLSSPRAKRAVAETVTHEIVHQWFGNLVTMRWWNDLWLNEAFATWLAYKVVDRWQPAWNTWLSFDARRQGPLAVDALASTRAIRSKAVSSADIRAMFDGLTYTKGGTILRMIEGYIGEAAFTEGVRLYMKRHAYGNTEADDLWAALEEASGKPVGRIARDWLGQPGYPLVKVESLSPDRSRLRLTQKRFTSDGRPEAGRWAVPVQLAYERGGKLRTHTVLLDGETAEVTLPGAGPVAWVYPNKAETGFFRVGLDEALLAALPADLSAGLAGVERTGLLGNLWAEAQAGSSPLTRFLESLTRFKGDAGRPMTEKTAAALVELQDGFLDEADAGRFARFAEELLGPRWKDWGYDKLEGDEDNIARASALAAYGRASQDAAFAADLDRRARAAAVNPSQVEPTLVGPLLGLAARRGGRELYELFMAQVAKAKTPEQRDQLLRALAAFRDKGLARATADYTMTEAVRPQDFWKPWVVLLRNSAVNREAWGYLKANWAAIRAKAGPRAAAVIIEGLGGVHDLGIRAEAEAFFADPQNMEPTARRSLAQSLEFMATGAGFEARERGAFSGWLRARYP